MIDAVGAGGGAVTVGEAIELAAAAPIALRYCGAQSLLGRNWRPSTGVMSGGPTALV